MNKAFLVQNVGAEWTDDLRYERVSTDGESVSAQVAALQKHAAVKVFREVARGPRPTGRSFGKFRRHDT